MLTIVALISTLAFYRHSKRLGLSPGRAASLPFTMWGLFLIVGWLGIRSIVAIGELADISANVMAVSLFSFHFFWVVAYLLFIRRNWLVLQSGSED